MNHYAKAKANLTLSKGCLQVKFFNACFLPTNIKNIRQMPQDLNQYNVAHCAHQNHFWYHGFLISSFGIFNTVFFIKFFIISYL